DCSSDVCSSDLAADRPDERGRGINLFLALACVAGRVVDLSDQLDATASLVREVVSPAVQWGVMLSIVVWYLQVRLGHRWPARLRFGWTPEEPADEVMARPTGDADPSSRTAGAGSPPVS